MDPLKTPLRRVAAYGLVAALVLIPTISPAAEGGGQQPTLPGPTPPTPPIYSSSSAEFWGLASSSDAWELECENAPEVVLGDLVVNSVKELDALRCYRVVDGDVTFQDGDPLFADLHFVGLPWLERITGKLIVNGGANLDEVWLARLTTLDGTLDADFDVMLEKIALPQTTSLGDVEIEMRSMRNDWTGLDTVVTVGHLHIDNDETDTPMLFGMNGLTTAGSLEIEGNGVLVTAPGVMNALTTVQGNVTIRVEADQVYGTSQIQTIGGNLHFDGAEVLDISGFASLQSVAGCIAFTNTPNLTLAEQDALRNQVGQANGQMDCL